MNDAHERARVVLLDSRTTLDRIAEALLERETISAEELEALMGQDPTPATEGGSSLSRSGAGAQRL